MKVRTSDGIDIYCLPEGAVCTPTQQNPLEMDECPLCKMGENKYECIPDACPYYLEEDDETEDDGTWI